jgi:phage baseplate assembly protein W
MGALLRHRLKGHETLRSLAVDYLGDHTRWAEIAHLNRLYADQFDLLALKWILLPIEVGPASRINGDPFLTDLNVLNGGLVLTESGALGTVAGLKNLARAILRALMTPKGALFAHPSYGMDLERYVAHTGNPLFLRFLKLEVERTILKDPRVERVENVRVVYQPTQRSIEIFGTIHPVAVEDAIELLDRQGRGVIRSMT